MKKLIVVAIAPLVLAACGDPSRSLPEGLQSQKPACADGNYQICSEIGHSVRDAQGGTTAEQKSQNFVLSQPIVD
ncbi:hypothetical protein TRL7639_02738 [Falsiruegeria litorea R37]|uniref:Lipoprotein n=1 Tax=Falsiruegeria litorea R37 TaxID=1200284 RepID=A0A1Y5SW58_9RHOB|nr:hypothetical protein [Falsiruegeria litorea]SLN49397.1 hypothetical protein TRL7639_02738 [Falsiruegeria litorea R37]